MTTYDKIKFLRDKVDNGEKINIAFVSSELRLVRGSDIKNKARIFQKYLENDERFQIHTIKTKRDYLQKYLNCDIVVPPMQYGLWIGYGISGSIVSNLRIEKKIINIRYSLGWHRTIQANMYEPTFLNFVDSPDIVKYPHDAYTGHPWAEYLNSPKEEFTNPWKTTNKKHILICPHHTVDNNFTLYRNSSNFLTCFNDFKHIINEFGSEVEFVMRPHPNLFRINQNRFIHRLGEKRTQQVKDALAAIKDLIPVVCEDDYVNWFKYSDAMIHDCGSFRCEYLFMDKPVCYMANRRNMDPRIWSKMGKEAINCHEIIWPGKGESLEQFVRNVLDEKDQKKDIREKYREKYCLAYPNGKTPCQNIVNAILGQEEYSFLANGEHYLYPMRKPGENTDGLVDLINHAYNKIQHNLTIVEVGTFRGEGAEIMLKTGKVDKIYCIDPWKDGYGYFCKKKRKKYEDLQIVEQDFDKRFRDEPKIVKYKGTLDQFINEFKDLKNVDIVYLDALTDYENVKRDIESSKKLTPYFISGHDYNANVDFGGVIKAVNETFEKPDMIFKDTSWIVENKQ